MTMIERCRLSISATGCVGLLTVLLCLICRSLLAASEADIEQCRDPADTEARIAACTRVLSDQQEIVESRRAALVFRGRAHSDRKDLAEAIVDFSAALKMRL